MMLTDLETAVVLRAFREELTTLESGLLVHYYGVGETAQLDVEPLALVFHSDPLRVSNIINYALAKLEPVFVARLSQVRSAPSKVLYMTDESEGEDDASEG